MCVGLSHFLWLRDGLGGDWPGDNDLVRRNKRDGKEEPPPPPLSLSLHPGGGEKGDFSCKFNFTFNPRLQVRSCTRVPVRTLLLCLEAEEIAYFGMY